MLSQTMNNKISLIAYATVSHLFALFHNPKMRGEHFTWEKFPELAESHVATQVFLNIPCNNKNKQKNIEEQGRKVGREIAEHLVKAMTE